MNRWIRQETLAFLGRCVLAGGLAAGPALAGSSPDFSAVDRAAAAAVADGRAPSLAFAVARDGVILHQRAFGLADVEAGVLATPRTVYPLASVTKPITATALMVLGEQQGLDLTAPIRTYAPDLRLRTASGRSAEVSLLHLLSHTSGLGTYARIHYGDAIPGRSLDAELQRYGLLLQQPGRVAEYSNLGYGVIGRFIEQRSGDSLAAFVADAVFRPLGMDDASIGAPGIEQTRVAAGYGTASERLPRLFNNTPGAGNAYGSARDLLRFAMFHLAPDSRLGVSSKRIADMQRNVVSQALHHYYGGGTYYGLGWYVQPDDDGHRVLWHEGGMPGASTIIKLLAGQQVAVVVLSNRTDVNDLTRSLADQLLRAVVPDYRARPLDPVADYAPFSGQAAFVGRWSGTILVDGTALPCSLTLSPDGMVAIACPDGSPSGNEASLRAMVNGDSLISAFPGRLPSDDIPAGDEPLLLLKLVRTEDTLAGALVAYSSPARLEYLLPFAVALRREKGEVAQGMRF